MNSRIPHKLSLLLAVALPLVLAFASTAAAAPAFKLDKRGFAQRSGKVVYVTVYLNNNGGDETVKGSLSVKDGKKNIKTNSVDLDPDEDYTFGNINLTKKQVKRLEKRGRLPLRATGQVVGQETGTVQKIDQKLTVLVGGKTTAYDGYYKGTGGLVINVVNGLLLNISANVNTFCPKSNKFRMESLYTLDGFPLAINKNGTFKAKGNQSPNSIRYEGKLTKKGKAKGYLSVFHTELLFGSEGRLDVEQCVGASNWKAKRTKR